MAASGPRKMKALVASWHLENFEQSRASANVQVRPPLLRCSYCCCGSMKKTDRHAQPAACVV